MKYITLNNRSNISHLCINDIPILAFLEVNGYRAALKEIHIINNTKRNGYQFINK